MDRERRNAHNRAQYARHGRRDRAPRVEPWQRLYRGKCGACGLRYVGTHSKVCRVCLSELGGLPAQYEGV